MSVVTAEDLGSIAPGRIEVRTRQGTRYTLDSAIEAGVVHVDYGDVFDVHGRHREATPTSTYSLVAMVVAGLADPRVETLTITVSKSDHHLAK